MRKDNRVRKLYQLESFQLPIGQKFESTEDMQAYVDVITGSRYWTANPVLPKLVNVRSHGDLSWSCNSAPNDLWIANSHRYETTILHELAHFYPSPKHHSPPFVRAYLALIAQFMGLHYVDIFREAFIHHKIKF